MSVWLTIPSKRPESASTVGKWRERGYRVALWRDPGDDPVTADLVLSGDYPGYAQAVNSLMLEVFERDPECNWCVAGGDDTEPDPSRLPETIAIELEWHFGQPVAENHTFGVMQPTGDRFAGGSIDRIAGSPWIGRAFATRVYGGNGPYYPGYRHMFSDEEIKEVAERLGVYWMRPDLVHLHRHFMRKDDSLDSPAVARSAPPHLIQWNSPEHWRESEAIFKSRKAAGFPGHEPLTA